MRTARRWDRTPSKRSVLDTVLDQVLREMYPRKDQPERRPHNAPRAAAKRRRQGFTLEPLEPRLLMSADISYTSAATNLTLKATDSTHLALFDDAAVPNQVGTDALSEGLVKIHRSGLGDVFGDTIHVDASTLTTLDASGTGITGNGNTL